MPDPAVVPAPMTTTTVTTTAPAAPPAANVPAVAPGVGTSEYAATKFAVYLGIAAAVVGLILDYLPALQSAVPGASKWTGPVLAIAGLAASILATLGYQVTRTNVKVAALNAAAAPSSVTAAQAAVNLGK